MDIYQILWQRVAATKAEMDEASREFLNIIGDIPSSLPHPDGTTRIRNASRRLSSARKANIAASRALTKYFLDQTIPDDLNE